MTTTTGRDFMTDMFKQATDSFSRTMQAGVKFQEDSARFWTDLTSKNLDEMRNQWEKLSLDATPFAKKNLEQFHKLFEEQTSKTLDLLRKTCEVGGVQNPSDVYERLTLMWRDSLDTIRQTTDAFAKVNGELFENCSEMIRKASGAQANGKPTPKPAAAK